MGVDGGFAGLIGGRLKDFPCIDATPMIKDRKIAVEVQALAYTMMGQLRPHSGPTTACYRQLAEHSIVPGKELSLAALQRFVRPAADLTV